MSIPQPTALAYGMSASSETFHGHTLHMVDVFEYHDVQKMRDWCRETFGPGKFDGELRWYLIGRGVFVFLDDADRVAFMLRWS